MEPIEDVIARAERRAIEEWEHEQRPPPRLWEVDDRFRAEIVKTRIGYRAEHIGAGLSELANCWPWALTLKGIHRKVDRIRRRYFQRPDVVEVIR